MLLKFLITQSWRAFGRGIHSLEYDPKAQYRFHQIASSFWFLTMIGTPFFPSLYSNSLGILVVLEVSLYANFATEFGSMSAAEAAIQNTSNDIIVPNALPGTIAPEVKATPHEEEVLG